MKEIVFQETPEIDLASKLGNKLKREMLIALAKEEYYPEDEEQREYIRSKYAKFRIPLEVRRFFPGVYFLLTTCGWIPM